MNEYTVDLSKVKSNYQVHEVLKNSLGFPDYYGMNLDALWDCLTDFMGDPIHIILTGIDKVPQSVQPTTKGVLEVFEMAKERMDEFNYTIIL